jgi:GT2 family glycosyltransferase
MKTFYFSATKGSKKDTLLYKTAPIRFFFKEKYTQAIAKVYNRAIDFAIDNNFDYLVLAHDDIIIESEIEDRLVELFETYDMVGVAGGNNCKLQEPALWHLMCGGFGSGNLHGAVAHGNEKEKSMTGFGTYPKRVTLIDGVFMAMKRSVFEKVRFDEECPAKFHFYDLDFCLAANKHKVKICVGDIHITHASPGLQSFTEEFNKGQKWFLNKWQS